MSEKAQRIVLWGLAFLIVGGTILALRTARGYRPLAGLPGGGSSLLPGDIGLRLEKLTVVGRDRGRSVWIVRAGRVETTRDRNRILFFGGITASLLPSGSRPAAVLTAPSALYEERARRLSLPVPAGTTAPESIVCTVRDLRVTATALQWDVGSHLVRCPGAIRALDRRGTLSGSDFQVNIGTREYVLRRVHLRFPLGAAGDLPL